MRVQVTTDVAVVALLGFCVWEVHKAYREAAPGLPDLRECSQESTEYYTMRQSLIDADCTVGLVALGAGITASYMTRSYEPLVLVMSTLGAISWYHHSVLSSCPV
jgi:hypothetical protein